MNQILNGIQCICEETSWMPPHMNSYLTRINKAEYMPDAADHEVELFSSETAVLLVWTFYLLKRPLDAISTRIGRRIQKEVTDRLLAPYLERDDYWWMGFTGSRVNNWTPWCNGNVLMALLVFDGDAQVRSKAIRKMMRSLDVFIDTYPEDGCCDEGPMYWGRSGASLYDCLELLHAASGGTIDLFAEKKIRDIGRYLGSVHIHENYYVNFADGDAIVHADPDAVYGYGKAIGDHALTRLGASIRAKRQGFVDWFPLYRHIRDLFQEEERLSFGGKPPYVRDAWMHASQVMTAREREGSEQGLFLAAKGGHNLESHNHNNVGNFTVYADGLPVFIDLGTEEYVAKTFSPQRFELWYLQSAYHNVPTIRGVMQRDGSMYRAKDAHYAKNANRSELSMDIAEAYPGEAGIATWRCSFGLTRGEEAEVTMADEFRLTELAADLYFSFLTPHLPMETSEGVFELEYAEGRRVAVAYDGGMFRMRTERIAITDSRLRGNWGEIVFRIVLEAKDKLQQAAHMLRIRIVVDPPKLHSPHFPASP
ncbi:heparinase II/III family protein [Paenibacillus hodogayensis]|uniref:Heparinase II/III family protein n=1 Tax=Paenibacillus hodogayensis TaxID=279208 RepID=A0ABV5W5Q4_9BACL